MVVKENNNVAIVDGGAKSAMISNFHNMEWLKHPTVPNRDDKEKKMSSKKRHQRKPKKFNEEAQKRADNLVGQDGETASPQKVWDARSNVSGKLFPNAEPAASALPEELDADLIKALEESIKTYHGENYEPAPRPDEEAEEAVERSENDGFWDKKNHANLPRPEPQGCTKISDANNNSSKISTNDGKINGRTQIRGIMGRKSNLVDDEVKNMSENFEKSVCVNQGGGGPVVDQYGRVDGQNEKHLFMGRGGRMKEQQYLEQQKQKFEQQQHQQNPQQQQQQQNPQQQQRHLAQKSQQQQPQQERPQQQQKPQQQQHQQQQKPQQQQPREAIPCASSKTPRPYQETPKYDSNNPKIKNIPPREIPNFPNQSRIPMNSMPSRPHTTDKYHYVKDNSRPQRENFERSASNGDEKSSIPDEFSIPCEDTKINEDPKIKAQSAARFESKSSIEPSLFVEEKESFHRETAIAGNGEATPENSINSTIPGSKILHLSDFNSRFNSSNVEENAANATSYELPSDNRSSDYRDFSLNRENSQSSTMSYAPPPGFHSLPRKNSRLSSFTANYPAQRESIYDRMAIHDPSLFRFLLQNQRVARNPTTGSYIGIRENYPNYENYGETMQMLSAPDERIFVYPQESTFDYTNPTNETCSEMMENQFFNDSTNREYSNEPSVPNDHARFAPIDRPFENHEILDPSPSDRSFVNHEIFAPPPGTYHVRGIDPAGNFIDYFVGPQNLSILGSPSIASGLMPQSSNFIGPNETYPYENLVAPETPRLQRSSDPRYSPIVMNQYPRNSDTWVDRSPRPIVPTNNSRRQIESRNNGNTENFRQFHGNQGNSRNFSHPRQSNSVQNFPGPRNDSQIPQKLRYSSLGRGKGRGQPNN